MQVEQVTREVTSSSFQIFSSRLSPTFPKLRSHVKYLLFNCPLLGEIWEGCSSMARDTFLILFTGHIQKVFEIFDIHNILCRRKILPFAWTLFLYTDSKSFQ